MIKTMGMIFIIVAGAYAGHRASLSLTRRVTQLEDIITFLRLMATQLRYTMPALDVLLEELSDTTAAAHIILPGKCLELMKQGHAFPEAWKEALDIAETELSLKKTDMLPLYELGERLGSTDVEGQLAIFSLADKKIGQSLAAAREERKRNGSLYRTLGLLTGVFIVLVTF